MGDVLELSVGVGRGVATEVSVTRELGVGDLALLRPQGQTQVLKLRESHHQIARLLARGLKQVEVSAITGYSANRISILKSNPAFAELVAHYREVEDSHHADLAGQVFALGADVLAELRDRLNDAPETFGNTTLIDFLTRLLDRSGIGPTSKVQAMHVHVTGEELDKLKQLAKEARLKNVTSSFNGSAATPNTQGNRGAEVGAVS